MTSRPACAQFWESGSPEFAQGLKGIAGEAAKTAETREDHGVHVYPDADDVPGVDRDQDRGVRAYPDP